MGTHDLIQNAQFTRDSQNYVGYVVSDFNKYRTPKHDFPDRSGNLNFDLNLVRSESYGPTPPRNLEFRNVRNNYISRWEGSEKFITRTPVNWAVDGLIDRSERGREAEIAGLLVNTAFSADAIVKTIAAGVHKHVHTLIINTRLTRHTTHVRVRLLIN